MKKLTIIVTVPIVLETWLKGQAKFLSKDYEIEIVTAYEPSVEKIQKHENVTIKTVDFTRKINPLKDLKVLIQLYSYLMIRRPSIVYTLTPKAGLLGMMAAWLARVPHRVHNVVGLPHLEAKGKRKKILILTEKITYWCANHLYCNSVNLVEEISGKLTRKPVKVIGHGSVNGVDTELFKDDFSNDEKQKVYNDLGLGKEDFIVTFVGRIVKDKGINELLAVVSILRLKYPQLVLLLIGDFEDTLDPISQESRKIIGEDPKIIHIPFQEDIRRFLAISDLFVLPSYREGLPNVLIEAGSFGIPLVATNINGCNEIIIEGENGLLVKAKDEISLYEALEKMLTDKGYYEHIKSQVRESITSRYSQKFFWKKLREEFLSIEKR